VFLYTEVTPKPDTGFKTCVQNLNPALEVGLTWGFVNWFLSFKILSKVEWGKPGPFLCYRFFNFTNPDTKPQHFDNSVRIETGGN